ncbi:AraC family transcriptional regulator [Paenibacillus qinlingensis]|uniref:AraC-like DNA-binding protein/mannose-6-phosphate isomerase-like protein (Cupin superfamily) n=1 Tax=Paenibacillus qinlingensis TaxID=1837343 RepID=A0ABU1P0S8_9BACL|nr:AraC family transcriptional regulator [Paenibacillus qinlingensis]MDR6553353.1 AraC-like DNA-binding protein/mannose-6-phosphate isomerase-like protein (cupin superfamily) [Paenibacillus qinlingensis]
MEDLYRDTYRFPNMIQTLQVTGCHFGLQPPGWEYPRHHHHLFELLYCSEGEVIHEINRETITMREGDWLLIKSSVRHRSSNKAATNYGYFNVHFDLDDADIRSLLAAAAYRHMSKQHAERSKLRFYVSELEAVMQRNHAKGSAPEQGQPNSLRFEDKLLLQSYTLLIIHDVLHLLKQQTTPKQHPSDQSKDASLFSTDVAHAIEEKLSLGISEEASVAGIAKEMNLSRSQCSKLFSNVYGLSPRQYVSQQKLKLAKELLVTTHLPMTAIADKLGFQSASHFSRQFRRWTGQSPSEFRPKHHTVQ